MDIPKAVNYASQTLAYDPVVSKQTLLEYADSTLPLSREISLHGHSSSGISASQVISSNLLWYELWWSSSPQGVTLSAGLFNLSFAVLVSSPSVIISSSKGSCLIQRSCSLYRLVILLDFSSCSHLSCSSLPNILIFLSPHSPGTPGVPFPHSPGTPGVLSPHLPGTLGVRSPHSPGTRGVLSPHSPGTPGVLSPHSPGAPGVLNLCLSSRICIVHAFADPEPWHFSGGEGSGASVPEFRRCCRLSFSVS